MDKVSLLEKQAVSKAAMFYKLQLQNKELRSRIKELENPDLDNLNNQLNDKQIEVDQLTARLEHANLSIKSIKAEKAKEAFLLKQKNFKLVKELGISKSSSITSFLKETKVKFL